MTPRARRGVVFAYFMTLAVLGLAVFRDYGVPWDEPRQQLIGGVSVRYVPVSYTHLTLPTILRV